MYLQNVKSSMHLNFRNSYITYTKFLLWIKIQKSWIRKNTNSQLLYYGINFQ